jgi:hypothetical protein
MRSAIVVERKLGSCRKGSRREWKGSGKGKSSGRGREEWSDDVGAQKGRLRERLRNRGSPVAKGARILPEVRLVSLATNYYSEDFTSPNLLYFSLGH